MIQAVRKNALPASRLPGVIDFYDHMEIDDFRGSLELLIGGLIEIGAKILR